MACVVNCAGGTIHRKVSACPMCTDHDTHTYASTHTHKESKKSCNTPTTCDHGDKTIQNFFLDVGEGIII